MFACCAFFKIFFCFVNLFLARWYLASIVTNYFSLRKPKCRPKYREQHSATGCSKLSVSFIKQIRAFIFWHEVDLKKILHTCRLSENVNTLNWGRAHIIFAMLCYIPFLKIVSKHYRRTGRNMKALYENQIVYLQVLSIYVIFYNIWIVVGHYFYFDVILVNLIVLYHIK